MNKRIQKKLEKWCYGNKPVGMFPPSLGIVPMNAPEVQRWFAKAERYRLLNLRRHPDPIVRKMAAESPAWTPRPPCTFGARWRCKTRRAFLRQRSLEME